MPTLRKYPQCQDLTCPLNTTCSRVSTRIEANPFQGDQLDVLLIADIPNCKEMVAKTSWLGPEKRSIENVLEKYQIKKNLAYTYLVRGWPLDRSTLRIASHVDIRTLEEKDFIWAKTTPLPKHPEKQVIIQKCLPYIYDDIEQLKPKSIIVFGKTVKDALFPNETKSIVQLINSYRNIRGIPVRFMSSPTTITTNPSSKGSWENQLIACLLNKQVEPDNSLGSVYILKNLSEANEYFDCLENTPNDISLDIETRNLNKRYGNKIATFQFSETNDSGVVLPYNHPESPFDANEIKILKARLYKLFKEPSKITHWVGQNLKFECNVIHSVIGTPLTSAPMFDTLIGAFLLDENRRERVAEFRYGVYSLKQLAYDYLNFDGYDKGILKERSSGNLWDLSLEDLSNYGAMDTYVTRRLMYAQLQVAEDQNYTEQFLNLMYFLYTPLTLLFSMIEYNGYYVNKKQLRTLVSSKSPILNTITSICAELKTIPEVQRANGILLQTGKVPVVALGRQPWVFNFAKQNHPQTLFFKVCGLPSGPVGKSGIASVDAAWQDTQKDHPLVAKYMEWSAMRHLYDSFATTLYNRIDPQKTDLDSSTDCRIRSNFLLTKAVTGRTACEKPNLQNIPRADTPAKKSIKNIFQATEGNVLVQLDYKANEVRWVGILSQDKNLAKVLQQGKEMMDEYRKNPSPENLAKAETYSDIHKQTASMVFNKNIEDVVKDERQVSKAVVFGILYGSSEQAIAKKHNKTVDEVKGWFTKFYERFPAISVWKTQMEESAKALGYIEALHGRRRRLPIFDLFRNASGCFDENLITNENRARVAGALRQSVNSPIQGIASDCGMLGAALFAKHIRENEKPWIICNAVHDSCIYEVPFKQLEESLECAEYWFTQGVMEYMEVAFNINFNLPLEIDFELGLQWGDLKKWNFNLDELKVIKEEIAKEMQN